MSDDEMLRNEAKRIDKMKYFGSLGKRRINKNSDNAELSSKRIDKMKYFGGIGKRPVYNYDLEKKSKSNKNIDKMRYMGSIGK